MLSMRDAVRVSVEDGFVESDRYFDYVEETMQVAGRKSTIKTHAVHNKLGGKKSKGALASLSLKLSSHETTSSLLV